MAKSPLSDPRRRLVGLLRTAVARVDWGVARAEQAIMQGDCGLAEHLNTRVREDAGRVLGALEVLTPGSMGVPYTRFALSDRSRPRRSNLQGVLVPSRDEGRGMAAVDSANRLHDRVQRACATRRAR